MEKISHKAGTLVKTKIKNIEELGSIDVYIDQCDAGSKTLILKQGDARIYVDLSAGHTLADSTKRLASLY